MKINDDIIIREIKGETVILNLKSGDYYSLNAVGNDIFGCMGKHMSIEDIVRYIVDTYDVDARTAEDDVRSLIDDLYENGILHDE